MFSSYLLLFYVFEKKSMIFLNISTDYVQLLSAQEEKLVFRNQVEYELWPILIQRFRKYKFSNIILLNGPGGFTNLRVGALSLNILKTLITTEKESDFDIQEISKLDLFAFAVQKGVLPSLWAIYIGQKKTLRLYDFDKKSENIQKNYKLIKKEDLPYGSDTCFFDKVYDTEYFTENSTSREISFSRDREINTPVMNYQNQKIILDINKIPVKKVDTVKANYMVQPVMG